MTDLQTHLDSLAHQPAEPASLGAVESAFSREGRWEELLRVYEDNAQRSDKDTAGPLYRKAAMVCINELSSPPRAEAYLKRAIECDPSVDALRELRKLYLAGADYDHGLELYEKELARVSDATEKARGLLEVAKAYREQLGRSDKALTALRRAQRADKDNPEIHRLCAEIYRDQGRLDHAQASLLAELQTAGPSPDLLDRLGAIAKTLLDRPKLHDLAAAAADAVLAVAAGDEAALYVKSQLDGFKAGWTHKIAELEERANQAQQSDPALAAACWQSIAEIQMVYGEQSEMALVSLDRALGIEPGHPGSLWLMEEIYGLGDRFGELAMKLEMMAAYSREPSVAVDLYLRAAMHNAVRLDNPDAAARLYTRVLELVPGQKVATNALAEYYRERGEWEYALQVLSVWADRATEASDKVAAHYACCRILDEELGDHNRAQPHHEAILELDRSNHAAAAALEDTYRKSGDHKALARVLYAMLSGTAGAERNTLLEELGGLYSGPINEPGRALLTLGELYQQAPRAALREQLEELAARANDFSSLVAFIEGGLAKIEDDGDKVEALHSLASLYEGARDAPLDALRIHRRILALAKDDERSTAAVERLLEVAAESGDKIAVYREQAEATGSADEKIRILHKLAKELTESTKDYVRAIDVYREILALAPGDGAALEDLLALYRRDNRWAEVADILTQKLSATIDGHDRVVLQLELGHIMVQHLDQIDAAVDLFCAVLDVEPNEMPAGRALEHLIARTKKVVAIAERLEPRYVAAGDWDRAADMAEIRVREATDPEERVALLFDLAKLYDEHLSRPADGLAALLRAFQIEPGRADVRAELERVAEQIGDYTGVIRAYRAAGVAAEVDERRVLILRAAAFAERGQDLDGAMIDYLRVLDGTEEGFAAGLGGLSRLVQGGLENEKITGAAAKVLEQLDPDLRIAALRVLARFYEAEMGSSNDAIAAWKGVLEAHQGDPEATAELDRLYSTAADPQELATHLRSKMEAASDDGTRAALGGQLAEVLADKLGDLDSAIAELVRVSETSPGQRLVWQRLAALYLQAGKPAERAAAMHRELNLLGEGEERAAALVAYAGVLGADLGDIPNAVAALQALFAGAAAHEGGVAVAESFLRSAQDPAVRESVASLLEGAYRAAERWLDLVALQASRVDSAADVGQRLAILRDLAGIKADRLQDPAGAFADLERAFREQPLDAGLRLELERSAEAAGAWEELAVAYTAALSVVPDANDQRPIRRKLAEVLDKRLGRGAEAVEHYKAAGGGDLPEDLPSLEAMERLLREQQNLPDLVEVLVAVVRQVDDVERKKALLLEIGTLCATHLGDKSRALDNFRELAELAPKDLQALRNIEALLTDLGQTAQLTEVLPRLINLGSQNPDLLEDYIKLANAQLQQGNQDEAFASFRAVLLKRREHEGAITGLENLIESADNKLEIAQVLEPIYTAKQDHEKLAWVLGKRLDGTEEAVQRKGLLRRIGDIYENRLGQKEQAFAMARRSLGEDPSDMGVRMWIEKLAGETGSMRELAEAYVEEAAKAEAPLNLQFHRRAAAILQEKLNDPPAAVAEYKAILAIEERDEKSLTGLEAIFRSTEDFGELVGVLKKRLELTAGVERKREYLTEIAKIQAENLIDVASAVESYRAMLEISPDDPAPFSHIEALLAQGAQWEELVRTYVGEEQRLAAKMGRDVALRRMEYAHRRASVIDQQFGDRAAAAAIFAGVLAEEAMYPSTIEYLAARAQEGILEFIEILEKVYSEAEQWQHYVALLETKLNFTAETEGRREVYLELAKTYDERLNAGDIAFQSITRAFNENRADLDLVDKLEATAEKYGYWRELVQVLGVDLDAIPDADLRQAMLRKLGEICGVHLGDPNSSIAYLNYALQYQPNDTEALGALDRILEANEMWAALADVLERRVGIATEASEKSQLLERLATIWNERLGDPEAALRCHQQIMEIDPDHPISLMQMQKLYAEVQNWDELAKNLNRQAEIFEDPAEQIRIHAAAGELYAEELNDMSVAIDHWQKVVELDPTHEAANNGLDVLLATEDRWQELADLLRNRLVHTQDAAAKLDINQRLGVIFTERLGRGDDAVGTWVNVLAADPKNVDALRSLLALYSERAMWAEFVDIAGKLIPLAEPAEAKQVKFRMAQALGENLGERDKAVKLAREVRATEPHTGDEMVALGTMLANIQAYDEAVVAIEKAGSLTEDPAQRVEIYQRAATIYRDQLEVPNDASAAYDAILAVEPTNQDAFLALAEVCRSTEQWRKLVSINEDFVPNADAELRLQILTEIRDVQDAKLGEKELAFIAACRVYKENPSDEDAAAVLERIALETDGAEEAAAVLEDEIDNITDPTAKVATYRRIARIYADELGETQTAEEMLNKILEIDAGDLTALDSLSALGAKDERFDKQIAALENKLQHVAEDTDRKAILFDIARIWEDHIGEVDEAVDALNRILAIDGADLPALDALARIYTDEQQWTQLAHVLTRKVELTEDVAEGLQMRMRVAQLCEGELRDAEAAIQWYRGILEFDQGHHGALAALDRLYTGLERWSELVQIFERQLAQAQTAEEQLSLLSKEASIYESEFSSPKDAAQCYERCFAVDQSHLPTVKNLERLLRILGEWNRLIEILGHHITLIRDVEEITGLYLQIGEVYYKELSRVDKAEQIYNMAREVNPDSDAALHALGQLYERSGNWFQGLEMMQREADAMGVTESALPVLMRIGRINEDMLGDVGAAQAAYQRALEIDPTYASALQAMKEIAKNAENWEAYSEHLLTEAETADDVEDKTDLFVEAAEFFLNVREDEMSAIRYYQRALEITPEHLDTCRALSEIFFRNEMWDEAAEMYEVVVKSLDKSGDAKEYCQKHYRLGYVREKLGERDAALEHYRDAFEADATYLPALEGLAQALLTVEQWVEAQKVFQTILIHHRDSLTESEVVDVQSQLGEIFLRQDQPDRAYQQFEKALEIDPDHAPSLSALAKLDQTMQRWESAYVRLSRLGEVAPGPERVQALLTMSTIAVDYIGDINEAIEPLERARKFGQASPEILERLGDLYLQANQVQKAVEALEEATTVCDDPQMLSELNFELAGVYENAIKHEPLAVQKYNAALDAAPTNIKAFEAIERILGNRGEWALLESNYRAMIARAKALSPKIRLVLWRALAQLYKDVLENIDSAIAAYEVIGKMDPGNPDDAMILAELYAQKPEKRAAAIAMQHDLIPTLENPVPPIKALRKLYHAGQEFDAVFNLCAALVFMNSADDEEKQVLDYLAQGVPPRASGGLREEHWRSIRHPGLDNIIGQVATELYKLGRDAFMVPAKDLGLKKKDFVDVHQSDLLFVNLVTYAGKVLGVQGVDLYAKAGSTEGIHLVNAQPPALVVGQNNELYRNPSHTRLTLFHLGRSMAYVRPELFLARMYPGEGFRDLLFGLFFVYNRNLQHTGHPTTVENWAAVIERLPQQALRRLQPMVQGAFEAVMQGEPLASYTAAVEHTVNRAGLLVSGDLNAAHHGISDGDEGASAILPRERIKELAMFAVSREYFAVRKGIGAALVPQKG